MVYQAFRQMRGKEDGADWKTIQFGRFGGFEGGLDLVFSLTWRREYYLKEEDWKLCCFDNLIKVLHFEKSTWLMEEELAGENWQQTWRRRLKL